MKNLKYSGASLAQGHAHLFLWVRYLVVLSKPHLHAKFEVANYSRCTNIKKKPYSPGPLTFSSVWDFMMGLGKPKLCTKFEVASFSDCVNIEGNPKFWGAPQRRATFTLSLACDFMMGLDKH